MPTRVDPSEYRDVLRLLFPAAAAEDAAIALEAFDHQFKEMEVSTVEFGDQRARLQRPSGILTRVVDDAICGAWAPQTVTNEDLVSWHAKILAAIAPTAVEAVTHGLLVLGHIRHCWSLPRTRVRLFPAPNGAPRPWGMISEHPAMLEYQVEKRASRLLTSTIVMRRLDWLTLLLNTCTYLRCNHSIRVRYLWTLDQFHDDRSRWVQQHYDSPELHDSKALSEVLVTAPAGEPIDDLEYYLRSGIPDDGAPRLPRSLDETLAAAESLPLAQRAVLRRASRWIRASDESLATSSSLSFVALAGAVECMARDWLPGLGPTARFKRFLKEMLPFYSDMDASAERMYRLRCSLVHEGLVFPDDWLERNMHEEFGESAWLWSLARATRLSAVNWIRSRAGLPHVPHMKPSAQV